MNEKRSISDPESRKKIKLENEDHSLGHIKLEEQEPSEQLEENETYEIDPQGETKIDANGNLLGDREFRLVTFKISTYGETIFVLATKVARLLNLRDSHNLFVKFPRLKKILLNNKEKFELIDGKILPISYKSRSVNIIPAKMVFQELGSFVVLNGKRITDDYYEQQARAKGFKEGEDAYTVKIVPIPEESHQQQVFDPQHGANGGNIGNVPVPITTSFFGMDIVKNPEFQIKSNLTTSMITKENWMLNHCLASKQLDYDNSYDRQQLWLKARRDSYTGVTFYPSATQAKRLKWFKLNTPHRYIKDEPMFGKISYSTIMDCPGCKITGLAKVDNKIFEGVVSPEVREAILNQQNLEKEYQ